MKKSYLNVLGLAVVAIALVMGLMAAAPQSAHALVTASYELGTPTVTPTQAEFDVLLSFTADAGEQMVFFSLDVFGSDPLLTGGGTDFSGFSFTPASPLLDDWNLLQDFGAGPLLSTSAYDTVITPLAPGNHTLGVLTVDLSSLAEGTPVTVSLDVSNSRIGVEPPGQPLLFMFVDTDTTNATQVVTKPPSTGGDAIPEPITATLGLISLAALATTTRRRTA